MAHIDNMPMPGERFLDQRKNADKSAFGEAESAGDMAIKHGGLTKRKYAAIQIMAGFASSGVSRDSFYATKYAVEWADNLMQELEGKK